MKSVKINSCCPDQRGTVGWALPHTVKGLRSDSWSGHMLGVQLGTRTKGNQPRFLLDISSTRALAIDLSSKVQFYDQL